MPDVARLVRAAPITAADPVTRTLTMQLLRWDDPRPVTDPGRPGYVESWARDSLVPLDRLYVVDRHAGDLIGRMDPPYDNGAGPEARLHIAHTRAGDDLLALVDAGVIDSGSIEALSDPRGEVWSADHRSVTRTRGVLAGVAFAFHPAHDAPILARTLGGTMPTPAPAVPVPEPDPLDALVRSLEALGGDGPETSSQAPPGPSPTAPDPAPPPAPDPDQPDGDELAGRLVRAIDTRAGRGVDELQNQLVVMRQAIVTMADRQRRPAGYRYGSWGEVLRASARGELTDRDMTALNRAIVDVVTADIPGLIPRPVLAQIFDIIAANQQLADAAGPVGLPEAGMTIDFPRVTGRPSVGPQVAEKTEVVSVKTTVGRASAPLTTLAGGEDVSIQAILRSSPSYLQLQGELYLEAMAIATDLLARTVYSAAVPAPNKRALGVTPKEWVAGLFDLAGDMLTVSRSLPDRLVISTDMWVAMGSATDADGRPLFTAVNPINPIGTVRLTSTEGDVREMTFRVDPNFPANVGALFSSRCFRSALGPVSTITADVPLKLGRDYAVYRFGAFPVIDANGLGLFALGATAPTDMTPEGFEAIAEANTPDTPPAKASRSK